MDATKRNALERLDAPVQLKLSAIWTSVMFCYIYGDYFGLYVPGKLKSMLDAPSGGAGQLLLLAFAAMMLMPSLMPLLSMILKPAVNRPINVFLGVAYSLIVLATFPGTWLFYRAFGVAEIGLTLSVAWVAWKWPRVTAGAHASAVETAAPSA